MLITDTTLTPGLKRWFRRMSDTYANRLTAKQSGADITILRRDGTEPSEPEQRRIAGLITANRGEPLK